MINKDHLEKTLAGMILSASGWRGVFAPDGEEGRGEDISPSHRIIAAAAGAVFAAWLKDRASSGRLPAVIVGTDTRPTGRAIAAAVITGLAGAGCAVRYAGITAAPEIMAYARASAGDRPAGAAFVYISASHNPIGHNGLKFGLDNGGVLQAAEAADLIARFRSFMARDAETRRIAGALEGSALPEAGTYKKAAYGAYLDFTGEVAFGAAQSLREAMAEGIAKRPVGIVCDFNGSARTLCIDREFLAGLGVSFRTMNDKPGEIVHRIIPEGESLEPCRRFLEELHADDPSFILGYVPDCDGDRGNLVIWDDGEGKARILEAQEVFALSCMAELAHLVWTGELAYDGRGNALTKAALAVNDPTSLRIERIAKAFDVPVFRAEVGEANVVGLARKLREKGCLVRILGEGSNGGTITHPSSVRDPLDTVMALLKLLSVRSGRTDGGQPGSAAGETGTKGLFELWCALSGQEGTYRPDFTLADIIASLPPFVTTGASTADGLLQVKTADHGALKDRYQKIFLEEWEKRKESLRAKYGITGWEAAAYNGIEEKRGPARFGEAGRGGLKIYFTNAGGVSIAAIWMRGSATEPVFRVMADAEGQDTRFERELIEWQRGMVREADGV